MSEPMGRRRFCPNHRQPDRFIATAQRHRTTSKPSLGHKPGLLPCLRGGRIRYSRGRRWGRAFECPRANARNRAVKGFTCSLLDSVPPVAVPCPPRLAFAGFFSVWKNDRWLKLMWPRSPDDSRGRFPCPNDRDKKRGANDKGGAHWTPPSRSPRSHSDSRIGTSFIARLVGTK
jgi:hypothetical protein